jgi:hypothetical protein
MTKKIEIRDDGDVTEVVVGESIAVALAVDDDTPRAGTSSTPLGQQTPLLTLTLLACLSAYGMAVVKSAPESQSSRGRGFSAGCRRGRVAKIKCLRNQPNGTDISNHYHSDPWLVAKRYLGASLQFGARWVVSLFT